MKTLLPALWLFSFGAIFAFADLTKSREVTFFLFENRRLVVEVPEGFNFVTHTDSEGFVNLKFTSPEDKVSGDVRFLPDPEGRFANARARKELMNEMFVEYVESSQEKAMQFEELDPRTGAGTYCVFTDAKLVGKSTLPPGEFLHLTTGVKAWPGVVAIFRFFSNATTGAEYQSLLKMLRESMHEKPVPMK
jgi:hypothetical protein